MAGLSPDAFARGFRQSPDDALLAFVDGLQRTISSGDNVHAILETLGFDNVRIRDALLRAAGAGDLFRRAIDLGTEAWEENIALTKEADLRYRTMDARWQFTMNRAKDFGITVGNVVAPAVIDLAESFGTLFTRLVPVNEEGEIANEWIRRMIRWGLFGASSLLVLAAAFKVTSFALGPMALGLKLILALYGFLTSGNVIITAQLYGLAIAQRAMAIWTGIVTAAVKVWTAVQWALNVALTANPIGIVIVAIGLLIAVIALLIIYWDEWTAKVRNLPGWAKALLVIFFGWIGALALIAAHWDKVTEAVRKAMGWMRRIPVIGRLFGSGGDGGSPSSGSPPPPPAAGSDLSALGFPGITSPLPVGPAPSVGPGFAALAGAGNVDRSITTGDLLVTVNAPGADSTEISEKVGGKLEEEFRRVVEAADSQIAR